MSNSHCLIALNKIGQIGPRTMAKLQQHWPVLDELFQLKKQQLEQAGLKEALALAISQCKLETIEEDLAWQQASPEHYILTWDDPQYPSLLKEIPDPPPVLYAKGDLSCLQQLTLAIVGSRNPSVTGRELAYQFAYELSAYPMTILSGLALGIDTQVHQGCLHAQGKTVAVMATGIEQFYPPQNRELAQKIIKNGLLISEFPLKTQPMARLFPQRNRIISGLSVGTLVVEATLKSGSLITARLALEQNREVLAIPGSILNPQSRGCHYLLQQGASLVTSSQDVLDTLGLREKPVKHDDLIISIAPENKKLVKCIGFEVTTFDQILARSGLNSEMVACGLASLEIEGIVKAVPGGYTRC